MYPPINNLEPEIASLTLFHSWMLLLVLLVLDVYASGEWRVRIRIV
jgi:hypothetical protein